MKPCPSLAGSFHTTEARHIIILVVRIQYIHDTGIMEKQLPQTPTDKTISASFISLINTMGTII